MEQIVKGVVIPKGLMTYDTYPKKVKLWVDATLTERERIIEILDNNLGLVNFDDLVGLINGEQE